MGERRALGFDIEAGALEVALYPPASYLRLLAGLLCGTELLPLLRWALPTAGSSALLALLEDSAALLVAEAAEGALLEAVGAASEAVGALLGAAADAAEKRR